MCLLITAFQALPEEPILLAANRDERYDRRSAPPALLRPGVPRAVGGRDLEAGGTWLGINERGLIAAVTNLDRPPPGRAAVRSRGLLCLDLLGFESAREAARAVAEFCRRDAYNPFTLVLLDVDEAWCATSEQPGNPVPVEPGWHVVSNAGLDVLECPRTTRIMERLGQMTFQIEPGFPHLLAALCRDHGACGDGTCPDALCRHGETAGTRSSSIVRIDFALKMRYWYADGPPCETPYAEIRLPWSAPGDVTQ